jgi:hypothetical protein
MTDCIDTKLKHTKLCYIQFGVLKNFEAYHRGNHPKLLTLLSNYNRRRRVAETPTTAAADNDNDDNIDDVSLSEQLRKFYRDVLASAETVSC